jgi:hypothetical protein
MKLHDTSYEPIKLEITLQCRRDYGNTKVHNGELVGAALAQGVDLET